MYTPAESQRKSAAASSEKTSSKKSAGLQLEDNRPDTLQKQEIPVSGNHRHTIQRFAMPAFAGQNPVKALGSLPPTTVNYATVDSGPFTVPAQSNALLGAFKAGGGATNTKLSIALQMINDARSGLYERCHLMANALGGGGNSANIVPARKTMNAAILANVENPIINARREADKRVFRYSVTANYGDHHNPNLTPVEKFLPLNFQFSLHELFWNGTHPSTNLANWGGLTAINLGHDATAVNDLSTLPAIANDKPEYQHELGAIKGLTLHFEQQLENALAAEGVTELMDVNRAKAAVRRAVNTGIIQADVVRALPRDVIGQLVEYTDKALPEIIEGAIQGARERVKAKQEEPPVEEPTGAPVEVQEQPPALNLSGKSQEELYALLDQMVRKYAEDVDNLLADALALRDKLNTV